MEFLEDNEVIPQWNRDISEYLEEELAKMEHNFFKHVCYYMQRITGHMGAQRVPAVPKIENGRIFFICPYCEKEMEPPLYFSIFQTEPYFDGSAEDGDYAILYFEEWGYMTFYDLPPFYRHYFKEVYP